MVALNSSCLKKHFYEMAMFQADFHFSLQQITLTEFLTGTPCTNFTCYSMNKFLVIEMILINEMILKQRTLAFPFKEVDDLTKV